MSDTSPEENKVFPHQASLPPLPVPTLEDTCARYLDTVKPLLTAAELQHTENVITDFCREGGVGPKLQAFLEDRAQSERNWIEEWWEQLAYLRTRTTMAVHINWFGVLPEWGVSLTNVQAAAVICQGLVKFRATLNAGAFPVEKMRGNMLDMHQFLRVFGMTRVPQEGQDELAQVPDSRHIVIMRESAMVAVPIYTSSGAPLNLEQLQAQLLHGLALAERPLLELSDHPPVSVLTSLPRDEWAETRATLLGDPTNAKSLELVESALFCIAFETGAPQTKEECAQVCLCGSGRNKWFDKSFTVVIFENGRGGLNAEHTPVDAMTVVSMFMYCIEASHTAIKELPQLATARPAAAVAPPPQKLSWKLSPPLHRAIERASVGIAALSGDVALRILQFAHFGKNFIKATRLHPDFFMQARCWPPPPPHHPSPITSTTSTTIPATCSASSSFCIPPFLPCRWPSSSRTTGCTAASRPRTRRGTRAPSTTAAPTQCAPAASPRAPSSTPWRTRPRLRRPSGTRSRRRVSRPGASIPRLLAQGRSSAASVCCSRTSGPVSGQATRTASSCSACSRGRASTGTCSG